MLEATTKSQSMATLKAVVVKLPDDYKTVEVKRLGEYSNLHIEMSSAEIAPITRLIHQLSINGYRTIGSLRREKPEVFLELDLIHQKSVEFLSWLLDK